MGEMEQQIYAQHTEELIGCSSLMFRGCELTSCFLSCTGLSGISQGSTAAADKGESKQLRDHAVPPPAAPQRWRKQVYF